MTVSFDFTRRTVIVTGAAQGIEFADCVSFIVGNPMINGETVRLGRRNPDGGPLMADIEVSTADDVVTIRLNRPGKRNAITSAMYAQLAEELAAADRADAAVVVLTGAGGTFTAGNDLRDMVENPPLGDNPPPVRFLAALTALRAVLVAAVDGPAIGVGTTVLLHCDLVYATARSTFRLPFVDLGLVPEAASTLLLPRLVGHQRAAQLMLFGERFDAEEALTIGIVGALACDVDELGSMVSDRTGALAGKPRAALHATKGLLRNETASTVPDRLDLDRRVMQGLLGSFPPSWKRPVTIS